MHHCSKVAQQLVYIGILASLLSAGTASAQITAPEPGVRSTWYAPTLHSDVWSVNQNPSALAFSEGLGALFSLSLDPGVTSRDGYQLLGSYSTRENQDGFALGIGGGLHIYRSFLGLDSTAFGTTLAIAAAFNQISFGLRYRLYAATDLPDINRFHTGDFSTTLRFTRHFGTSLGIENLWNPNLAGTPVPRIYSVGVAARSTEGRFGIDVSYRIPEDTPRETRALRASISGVAIDGLRLFAQTTVYPWRPEDTFGLSAGIEWTAGQVTTGLAAGMSASESDPAFFSGSIAYQSRPPAGFIAAEDTLYRVTLSGELSEVETSSFLGLVGEDSVAFTELLWNLWQVAESDLAGVFLHLSGIEAGPAQLFELREALDRIKAAGKQVVVYVERGGLRDLIVLAQATYGAIPPSFYTIETGIASNPWYFGGLLEELGIPAQFVRTGDYKTGPERFTRSESSPEAQEQRDTYLDRVFDFMVDALSGQGRDAVDVENWLRDSPVDADDLIRLGLANQIAYEDELAQLLEREQGRIFSTTTSLDVVHARESVWIGRDEIAVIHIDGSIVVGESGRNPLTGGRFTGSKSIEQAVSEIANNPRIRGAIVRIDSPGGSALASDEIHRALAQLSRRKPVTISMGDIAGSGGYYVAAIDAKIIATPVTLTGSIGVYAGTIAYQTLIEQFGISRERSERGGPSDFFSGREWSETELDSVQRAIDFVYERFLMLVADARGLSRDEAAERAGGRIWVGEDALDQQLVDGLGGFAEAYDTLCGRLERCSRRPLPLVHFPEQKSLSIPSLVLAQTSGQSGSDSLERALAHVIDATFPGMISTIVPYLSEPPGSAMLISPEVWTLK